MFRFYIMSALLPFVIGGTSALNGYLNYQSSKQANEANLQAVRETNQTNKDIAAANNEWSLAAMREQNEWNRQQAVDMFRMENEYNSPSLQMQRLRDAGINPAVALGGSTTSIANSGDASTPTAAGLPAPVTPQIVSPHFQPVTPFTGGLIQALGDFAKMSVDEASSRKIRTMLTTELENLQLNNEGMKIANSLQMKFGNQTKQAEYNLLVGKLASEMSSAKLMETQTETEVEKQLGLIQETFLKKAQALLTQKQIDVFNENFDLVKKDYLNKWSLNKANERKANAEAGKASAETNAINTMLPLQQTAQILDNGIKSYGFQKQSYIFFEEVDAILAQLNTDKKYQGTKALEKLNSLAEIAKKENEYWLWLKFGNQLNALLGTGVKAATPFFGK